MLALTYNLNPTTVAFPSAAGIVHVADLTTFYPHTKDTNLTDPNFIMANQLAAHMVEHTLTQLQLNN